MHFDMSKRILMMVFLTGSVSLGYAGVSVNETELFAVDFNDLTPGSYIGDGGSTVGEPSLLGGLTGQVFQQSPGENYLELQMEPVSTNAKSMRWDFLDGGEVTEGVVVTSYQFTPTALDEYSFGVREGGGSSRAFLTIHYRDDGTIWYSDYSGVLSGVNGVYTAGATQDVVMTFDIAAATSSLTINGVEIFSDQVHGITDRGIGRLLTGYQTLSNNSPFYLDNLSISTQTQTASQLLLDADFQDYEIGDFLGTGGAVVDEPFDISYDLYTEIVASDTESDQALYMENGTGGGLKYASWNFYDDHEVTTGLVTIEFDVEFASLEQYILMVRENTSNTASFSSIRFRSDGKIYHYDTAGYVPNVGTYQAYQEYRVSVIYDLDNGTVSLKLDDDVLVADRSYGYSGEKGVGKIMLGFDSASNEGAAMIIDDIQVSTAGLDDDLIFEDGFEISSNE